jgi:hypothetical protein
MYINEVLTDLCSQNRRTQRHKIDSRLHEGINRIRAYKEKNIDHDLVPQEEPLLQFQRSVNRFVDQTVFQERSDRKARRTQDDSSVLTSQSTATTRTRSTQPSPLQSLAPESPPTSPEPSIARGPLIELQREENGTISIHNFCPECLGTCTDIEAHYTFIWPLTLGPRPQVIGRYPPTQSSEAKEIRTPSRPQSQPTSQRQPSSANSTPESRSCTDSRQNRPSKPSVEPAEEDTETSYVDPVTLEEDQDDPEDEISEEDVPAEEQATGSKPSIWRNTTGVFEGDIPKSLRIRRQESRSP